MGGKSFRQKRNRLQRKLRIKAKRLKLKAATTR